jgi:peptidoglycan hydrolase-like protein with peptidoglycan-binding domain
MIERSLGLPGTRCCAILLAFLAAMVAPAATPAAADAEIRGADHAPANLPFNLVKAAQRFLVDQGYQPGPVDGIAGARTEAAVTAWQRDHGLDANGALDSATLAGMGLVPQ